ncbi:sensor histidine kinase [Micromonospora sp. KC723]|uniref:sensor histidine kinase n=1 Tax=Micromonospora sp. KC723 TaxID=2530381 RepID=UPI0010470124|nr:sensor histidine kinase [Micromonospora sp. KC723]TDB76261.1 sensor histidine kinase [Micromonospora sp. KC723]
MGPVGITDQLWAWGRQLPRPSGPLPRPSRRSQVFDVLLALGISVIAIQGSYGVFPKPTRPDPSLPEPPEPPGLPVRLEPSDPVGPLDHHGVAWAVVMVLIVAPLVARRRFPLAMLWAVMGTAVVAAMVTDDRAIMRVSFYTCVIAAYSAAVYSPYRMPALGSQLAAAVLYSQVQSSMLLPTVSTDAVAFLVLIPIAIATDGLRRWRHRADEERARTAALERERDEATRRAAEQERARIARELHDVVTHNVSMMVIQAGAARTVMAADPEQARQALLAVEAGGRAAMSELRHVMGLLTMNTDNPADPVQLVPQPGLDRLDALVAGVRAGGVPVELTVVGQPRAMPGGVELAAYRVVQEALTNTVKHAGGASATVVVEYGTDCLHVEVADTGGTPRAPAATGNGRGLIGLRERLAVYGGSLHAGSRPRGGYRVRAHIPWEAL